MTLLISQRLLGSQNEKFSSTTEYLHHIVDGDLRFLDDQPNSVDDERDARKKYVF
jgi:hypothetical protein